MGKKADPHRSSRKIRELKRKAKAGQDLTPKALRRLKRHLEAEREAENARFWVGKVKSADRLLYTTPVNKAAAKIGGR
jgi:hypothetical protein